VSAEHLEDDDPIEEILLHGFPNPERVGCPPPETIQALAERKIGRDDPAWGHIWHCSPCFADFKRIRDKRLANIEGAEKSAERKRKISIWSAVALACACLIAAVFVSVNHLRATVVPIDLSKAVGAFRGQTEDDGRVLATLPRRLDELRVTLPLFSPPGRYVLAILKSRSESTAIALGSANANGSGPRVTLVVKLDLSAAKPGRYYLATRREEQGQEEAAYYYPILIRSD
jgi:hypothetical protein